MSISIVNLPLDVVAKILMFLPWDERERAARAIPNWDMYLDLDEVWQDFIFKSKICDEDRKVKNCSNAKTFMPKLQLACLSESKAFEEKLQLAYDTIDKRGRSFRNVALNYHHLEETESSSLVQERIASKCERLKNYSLKQPHSFQHMLAGSQNQFVDSLTMLSNNTSTPAIQLAFPKMCEEHDPISYTLNKSGTPQKLMELLVQRGPVTQIEELECYFPSTSLQKFEYGDRFENIKTLCVSVHVLSTDILCKLAKKHLRQLHVLHDIPTTMDEIDLNWNKVALQAPDLLVYYRHQDRVLPLTDLVDNPLLHALTFDTIWTNLTSTFAKIIVNQYSQTLTVFCIQFCEFESTQEKFKTFKVLIEGLPHLKTLVLSAVIEAPILLKIAQWMQNHALLMVTMFDIIWGWEDALYPYFDKDEIEAIKIESDNVESLEKAVSRSLGYHWIVMSEEEFSSKSSFLNRVLTVGC